MPRDRRRHHALEAWLLSPLPWSWQERIPSPATGRLIYFLAVVWLFGPWPLAGLVVGIAAWRVYGDGRKLGERKTWWAREVRTGRAIWVVRVVEDWRWRLLHYTGILWLPAPAPLSGGDVILLDIRGEREEVSVQFFIAGRLANPAFAPSRRHRRLVRLQAFWTLKKPLPLTELPETARAATAGPRAGRPAPPPPYLVRAVEPLDEEAVLMRGRLEAKDSIREPRKPTWRHERRAHDLFHQLWSSQGPGVKYDKQQWCDLQNELKNAGVMV